MGNSLPSLPGQSAGKDKHLQRGKNVLRLKLQRAAASGQLNLDGQGLKELPSDVLSLAKLKIFSCRNNRLKSLPEALAEHLPSLRRISVDANQLGELPLLESMMGLTHISGCQNALEAERILALPTSLTHLELQGNPLGAVPSAVLGLGSILVLNLAECRIPELPDDFGLGMPRIEELILDDNALTRLPASCGELALLKTLRLKRNRIGPRTREGEQGIPEAVLTATALQALELEANPITKEELMEFDGIQAFSERRMALKNKSMMGGTLTTFDFCGLDQ